MKRGIRKKRMFLLNLLKKHKPNRIGCEIGVNFGDFSFAIYEKIKPEIIFLIDPWKNELIYKEARERFKKKKYNVSFHKDRAENIIHRFGSNLFDWIYLDADHEFESTYKILCYYWDKLKSNGLFIGDDYSFISPLKKTGSPMPVKKAVDMFMEMKYRDYEVKSYQILGDQFIITKA